jgi:hypothetical protein
MLAQQGKNDFSFQICTEFKNEHVYIGYTDRMSTQKLDLLEIDGHDAAGEFSGATTAASGRLV